MGEWKHGLCGCFDNCGLCIMTYFLPCVVWGQTAEKVGENCCLCGCCVMMPIGSIVSLVLVRGKVREQLGIDGTACNDLICSLFCPFCAMVQTAQEFEPNGGAMVAMARQ